MKRSISEFPVIPGEPLYRVDDGYGIEIFSAHDKAEAISMAKTWAEECDYSQGPGGDIEETITFSLHTEPHELNADPIWTMEKTYNQ